MSQQKFSATAEDTINVFDRLFQLFQPVMKYRRGMLGDGNGNVNVVDRHQWSYIRYDDEPSKLSMVRNLRYRHYSDYTPVWVGKEFPSDKFEQVLGLYRGPYSWSITPAQMDDYSTAPHGWTHAGRTGSDPVPIDLDNIAFGMVVRTDPESMFVDVYEFLYPYGLQLRRFPGGTIDLSAHVPLLADSHCYALVYLDVSTETLGSVAGTIVPTAATPDVPDIPEGSVPLGVVTLYFGQTEIERTDIQQYKDLLGVIGGTVDPHTHTDDDSGGSSIIGLEELFLCQKQPIWLFSGHIYPTHVYHEIWIPSGMYLSAGVVEANLTHIFPDPLHGSGQLLVLTIAEPGMYVDYKLTVVHGAGNIRFSDGFNRVLESAEDHIVLIWQGSYWTDLETHTGDFRIGIVTTQKGTPGHYGNKLWFSGGYRLGPWNSDNSDPLWIARYNLDTDKSRLRINIGDGDGGGASGTDNDCLDVGFERLGMWYNVFRVLSNRTVVFCKATEPADSELNASEFALWLDPTPGASILKIIAKDSNGNVVSADVALT